MRASFITLILLACPVMAIAQDANGVEFFEKKIRPVLVERCHECHSATAKKIKGAFQLDTREGLRKGGISGPAIVPGDPEKSALVLAIRHTNPDTAMPPDGKLSDAQIADLTAWIKMGAPDPRTKPAGAAPASTDIAAARNRWPYTALSAPAIPQIKNPDRARNSIDHFILDRLDEKQLTIAPPADRRTLLRRATYDLTGLPPSAADIESFLNDKSPDAFAKVIDRLLASPQYGQRYARHWLDLVRYTDSFDARGTGGAMDCADAWRYRDWVVNALNADVPYNTFVKAQIAGDILGPSLGLDPQTLNPLVATSVYALGNWGGGDADKEKLLTDIVDDQVDLTSRAFLGLTLACARCHDHKFDPVSAADYYGMAGIFFSSHILPDVGPKTNGPNMLRVPIQTPEEIKRLKQAQEKLAQLKARRDEMVDAYIATLSKPTIDHLADLLGADAQKQTTLNPLVVRRFNSLITGGQPRPMSDIVPIVAGIQGVYALKNREKSDTPSITINTTGDVAKFSTISMPASSIAVHPSPKAGVSAVFAAPISGKATLSARLQDADGNCGDGIAYQIIHRRDAVTKILSEGAIPNGGKTITPPLTLDLLVADQIELLILPNKEYTCDTTTLDLTVTLGASTWNLTADVLANKNPAAVFPDQQGRANVWRFTDRLPAKSESTIKPNSALAQYLNEARKTPRDAAALSQRVRELQSDKTFLADLANPRSFFWAELRDDDANLPPAVRDLKSQIAATQSEIAKPLPMTHALQEGGVPGSPHAGVHDVKVHLRGRYDRLGDNIPRRFPAVLAGESQPRVTAGSGRVELANWITDLKNPLTSRVIVNRLWQWHFGEGLVRTPNNFGHLGTPPTHPQLLDHLATQLIENKFQLKPMHRMIMLSAAYQRVSEFETAATDPENLLWSRFNRRRLDAEELRDSLLSITGELQQSAGEAVGGVASKDFNSPRRTLYLMTIRSDRANFRMLFDGADPTSIIDKRIDSTVAPQALFMLNNPFTLERAKKLAAAPANLTDTPARITVIYGRILGRAPYDAELRLSTEFLNKNNTAARWQQFCHALLCGNEFMYLD